MDSRKRQAFSKSDYTAEIGFAASPKRLASMEVSSEFREEFHLYKEAYTLFDFKEYQVLSKASNYID